jgi:hypothetical protein
MLPRLPPLPALEAAPPVLGASEARRQIDARPQGPSGYPVVAVPVGKRGYILREVSPDEVYEQLLRAMRFPVR